jgi:predicted dithiol-disulfide oxidoreductase (DUF899 family)
MAGTVGKLQAYKRRMGWTFPWASLLGSDFNFDFNVSFTEEQQREGIIEYNYERGGHAMDAAQVPEPVAQNATMTGTDAATYSRDRPGMSAFVLEDDVVYHTYSTYARGLDALWGMYQWLDRSQRAQRGNGRHLVAPPRRVLTAWNQGVRVVGVNGGGDLKTHGFRAIFLRPLGAAFFRASAWCGRDP